MSGKSNSTVLNTLLGVTWGASTTSMAMHVCLPVDLALDLIFNLYAGLDEAFTELPAQGSWWSNWTFHDAFFGMRSKRQGVVAFAPNGLIPRLGAGRLGALTLGQTVWARKSTFAPYARPRMLEVWDIAGSPGVTAFSNQAQSAVAIVATTGGKVRIHATPWSRGFGNSVDGDSFADTKLPGEAFARGMIHLAEPLPDGFPTGDGTSLRVDEYTSTFAAKQSVAAIETSLAFVLSKGAVQQGQVLHVTAPEVLPVRPDPFVARVKTTITEPYDGIFRTVKLDTVTLESELPQAFAGGQLRVRRIVDVAGTARSGPWQGGPTELTQAQAETLPAIAWRDLLRVEATGGAISFAAVQQIELELNLTPPMLEMPEQGSVDLLRADATFTARLKDFTEQSTLTLTAGHPAVAKDDLLLIRLGEERKHVLVTAVSGDDVTIFPAANFTNLALFGGTPLTVQRWVPTGDKDAAVIKSIDGNTLTVIPPRASLFRKGSMVAFKAGGKRAFREIATITDIKLTLAQPATGAAPFTIEVAQFDQSLDATGVPAIRRHRRLRFVSGDRPSAYGAYPQALLGVRPRIHGAVSLPSETLFFTKDLANPDPAHDHTWTPLSEGGQDYWIVGSNLPVETDGSDTLWRYNASTIQKFTGAAEVDVVEYPKGTAERVDGTPAGTRVRVHEPEVQVPESPSITETHLRSAIEHEMKHVVQCADWGPVMFALPVSGVVRALATFNVAAGDNPPAWALRLLDNRELDGFDYASYGGLMQLLFELVFKLFSGDDDVPDSDISQIVFNHVGGSLVALIPDLDPNASGGEKFGVALLQLLGHVLDFRSWTPGLGLFPWIGFTPDKNFLEQQATRASGGFNYTTILSAGDRFNADYRIYLIPKEVREADGERSLGSVTRLMTWPDSHGYSLLSLDHGNGAGSPVSLTSMGGAGRKDILTLTADAEVVIPAQLYTGGGGTPLSIEGPASPPSPRPTADFHVVPAGGKILPRLRSFVPTPPRVNRSTGYYFIPAAPASYTFTAEGVEEAPGTNVVRLKVTEGNVTLGRAVVPWVRPVAVGAPLDTLPVLRMSEGTSRLLSIGGATTGWTVDLDSNAQFTVQNDAQGWRIVAPRAFAANTRVRVRLYRVFQPDDPAFDLTYSDVPTLQGVRSLLDKAAWIPVRDFVIELVRAMKAEVVLNGNPSPAANYIGWSPRPATIRLAEAGGATGTVTVTLRNPATSVGKVVFSTTAAGTPSDTLELSVPAGGATVSFFVRGKFGSPSVRDKDAVIEAVSEDGDVISRTELMVRVRKNANRLTDDERDRFVGALATFNGKGAGRFAEIRSMHTGVADPEAHNRDGFLPWHRAYVLDLERELQAIDPSVTIPYWKFDEPAPRLFTADFLGEPNPGGSVRFAASNPLQDWNTDSVTGFERTPRFNAATEPAFVISQADTLGLGSRYEQFRQPMEIDPHGAAHTSFFGPLRSVPTAPRDPIFFLLHANVDRLWARWQKDNDRFDVTDTATYPFLGRATDAGSTRIGHNLLDTMWPWNGATGGERPPVAPGGGLARSPVSSWPPEAPTVGDMIDWQGRRSAAQWQGFDYDDVEF